MVELTSCTYEEFPKYKQAITGMKTVEANLNKYNVQVKEDVVYHRRNGIDLNLRILVPNCVKDHVHFGEHMNQKNYPTIVYVPGSAWHKQQTSHSVPTLYKFAEEGYVIVIVEYCSTDNEGYFPTQIYDLKHALNYIQKHANEYYIDVNHLILFGDSSGAHTVLGAGITQNTELVENEEQKEMDYKIQGIIDFYGPTDILEMGNYPSQVNHSDENSPEGWLIGKKDVVKHPQLAEPTVIKHYISEEKQIPPILMVHGNKDRLVPFQQSVDFYTVLKEKGKKVEFYCLDGADHGGSCFWDDNVRAILLTFIEKCKGEN